MARLSGLPRSERSRALQAAVEAEFRQTLQMTADEDLPLDQSFTELGLSSLGLMETKERLEAQLGASLDATVLFNHPTVRVLLDYLATEVLVDLFAAPQAPQAAQAAAKAAPAEADLIDTLMDDMLGQLYGNREHPVGKETGA
ncbi:MAG: acyl carrier protein [Pseudonocardiaceae bacterium]